jgi:hypothetical protein
MLVYIEEYASVIEARAREAALKRWRREWKFALIEELNPEWRDLAGELTLEGCVSRAQRSMSAGEWCAADPGPFHR